MNTEAKEKVDNSTELFRQKQAEMSDEQLIELAEKQVTELARTGGRSHKMCVPPIVTDTDMLFSELIRRFKERREGKPDLDTYGGLHLAGVIESIPIHDIRNKLSPVCNLIAMIVKPECEKYIDKEIENCKKSINYLANREVYSL